MASLPDRVWIAFLLASDGSIAGKVLLTEEDQIEEAKRANWVVVEYRLVHDGS